MPLYKDPTGKVIKANERWAEDGRDFNRDKLTANGFTPLVKFYAPDDSRAVLVNQTSTNIDLMKKKGWVIEQERQAKKAAAVGTEGKGLRSGTVTKEEIQAIAQKNNVPFEFLDELVEFVGVQPEYRDIQRARATLGAVGRGLGGNLPQFIYRELQEQEKQQAFSDLQKLAGARQGGVEQAAEMVGGLAVQGPALLNVGKKYGVAAGMAAGSALGAAEGAAYQAATSEEGEELEMAMWGALAGATLGGIGGLFKAGELKPENLKALSKEVKAANQGKDIEKIIADARVENADVINTRRMIVLEGPVSKEGLQKLGSEVAKVKRVQKTLEKQDVNVQDPKVLQELGSIDLDYRTLQLAAELGWEGKTTRISKMVSDRGKFAQRVSAAKNFVAKKKAMPGGEVEVEQAFNRMTDKSIARHAANTVFKNDKQERFVGLRQFLEAPVDGKYVVRGIDRRLGTNLERTILDMDNATNKLSYILAEAQGVMKDVEKKATAVGLDVKDFRKYVEKVDEFNSLKPEQKAVVQDARNFFKKHRDVMVNEFKFKIGDKGETYFPHRTPSLLENIRRIKGRAEELKQATGIDLIAKRGENGKYIDVTEEEWKVISESDPDLVQALNIMGNTKINNGEQFSREFFAAITPGAGKKPMQATEASAAFLREETMPDFMLNNDLINGGLGWVQETYRHVMIKNSIAELQRVRDIAEQLKDQRAVAYLNGLLDDMTGLRVGTLASETTKAKLAFRVAADDLAERSSSNLVKSAAGFMRDAPEAFSTMLATAYPNFLGLSPRAALMNFSQIFTMTMPEVGYAAGAKYASQAMADMGKLWTSGMPITVKNGYVARALKANIGDKVTTKSMTLFLANEGHVAKQFTQELADALQGDMRLSLPVEVYKSVANKYSQVAMAAFSTTETINRFLAAQMGEKVARDLIAGDTKIINWLRTTPVSNQRRLLSLIESGNEAAVIKEVQDYLLSKTILNYTRQSMSNFGRYMGPMFSMFTKWPSTMYGEIIEQYASRGFKAATLNLGARFMLPLAVLAAVDLSIEEEGEVENPVLRALVGRRGVTGWAPITSVEALAGGEFLKSPAADVVGQASKIAFDPTNAEQWKKAMGELTMTFVPGMSILRFMDQEATLLSGEKPKRSFDPVRYTEEVITGE